MGKKKRQKNKNASGQQQTSQPVQSPQQGKSSQQQHGSQQPQHSGQLQRSQQQQRHALQGRSPKKSHEPRQSQQPHQQFGAPQLAQQSQQQGGISQNIQQSQQSQQTPQTQQSQQQLRVFQLGQQSEQQANPPQQTQQGRPPQQSQQPHQQLRAPQLGHQSQQQGGQQLQQCQQPQQTQQSQQQLRALQLGQQSQQQSQQAQQTQQPQQQRRSPQQTQQLQQQLRAPQLDQQSQQERTSQQSQQPTPQWFKPQQGQPLPQSPKRQQGASHQERQHRPQEQPQKQHQPLLQQSREECQLATSFPSLQLKETTLQHSEISKTPSQQSTPSRETSVEQDDKLKESTKGQTQKAAQQEMESETEPESAESGGGDIMAAQSVPTSGPLDLITPKRASSNSRGILGRLTRVETNHLVLNIAKLSPTVHYDVTIEPNKPKKLLRAAMEAFRVMHYPTRYQAFDGTKNLYAASILPFGNEIQGEVEIVEEGRRKTFTISVKFAAMIDMSVLSRYFTTRDTNAQSALQCLDVALRSGPSLNCLSVGRSFFTKPRIFHDLGEGMEMYYGFYQSAILGWKPFLNVDVVHKAFPKSLQIIDLIKELCPRCDLGSTLSTADFTTVDTFLRMLKVSYQIPNNSSSKRVMRINQLDKTASEATFTDEKGQRMTVAEYFINFKRFRLRYPNLPCAWVGSKQRSQKILFPLELCTLLDGQVTNRTLTPNQTKKMIEYGATSTQVRKEKIMHSIQDAHYNEDPCTREFGLSVSTEFAKVPARILDSPSLKYGADRIVKPRKGVWRATSYKTGKVLCDWGICCLDGTRTAALEKFSRTMFQQGNIVGMSIDRPQFLDSVRLTYRGAVAKKEIETQFRKYVGMQLIVVVIPKDIKYIYNYVKQVSELITGTLTQCVKGPNVVRLKDTTVANILLKVNAKLNGTNHILSLRPPCFARPCMIMGADVTHPSPEARGNTPSVAAVTASQDQFGFQYNFCWRLQPPTNEIIDDLANITRQLLRSFYQKNRCAKPERIIFFRDGVSEGQFPIVLNAEVQAIRNACLMLQKDGSFKPKITFLVVQKRHHTRFFPLKREDSDDRNFNVPAGTIVDTEITHPTEFDFYLVSHASVQGVARPTRYRKLWDDANMSEDELEQLTYHLCHMFTRCTRSVSYPAPTYYAHLAAARAKVYCENRQLNMSRLQYEQDSIVIKPEIVSNFPMFFV